jgi:CubicO group peptidase (beta-lactamase class C family)
VKDILPDFNIKDDTIRSQATITDLLSHRTGFTVSDYYLGAENNVLISKEDTLVFLNDQIAIQPIRSTWQYNNLGYELVSLMIDKVSSSSWADLLRDRIFKPLQLKRTMLDYPPKDDGNVARLIAHWMMPRQQRFTRSRPQTKSSVVLLQVFELASKIFLFSMMHSC